MTISELEDYAYVYFTPYNIEKRQYIAENQDLESNITDIQLKEIFTFGFEFVDYSVNAKGKLAAVLGVPDGFRGHTLEAWS